MSSDSERLLQGFLEDTKGRLVAVAVSGVLEDGSVSTTFLSGDYAFQLLGSASYLQHRILTEVIQPPPPDEPASETHQSSGAWKGAQKGQESPDEDE